MNQLLLCSFICLLFRIFNLNNLKFVKAISTISLCNDSMTYWKYCVNAVPTNRNWYQAAAECRSYGGELVALESQEKIDEVTNQLKARDANLSARIFVNANRPFYSGNDNFAWSSGIEFQLSASNDMEDCVTYSSSNLNRVACDQNLSVFLVCQRQSQRKVRTNISEQITVSFSKTNINYSHESCDYFTFVKFDYNWYQAKKLCRTFNSELLGIPRKRECRLIEEGKNLSLQSDDRKKYPIAIFLNMHLHMYARNMSPLLFRDSLGEVMNESTCGWKSNLKSYSENEYCISFKEGKSLSASKCDAKEKSDLIGFICKQCHPNKVDDRTTSMVSNHDTAPSITKARPLYYAFTFFICVILVLPTVAFLFVLRQNCSYRTRMRSNFRNCDNIDSNDVTEKSQSPPPLPLSPRPETSIYDYDCDELIGTIEGAAVEKKARQSQRYTIGTEYRPSPLNCEPNANGDVDAALGGEEETAGNGTLVASSRLITNELNSSPSKWFWFILVH